MKLSDHKMTFNLPKDIHVELKILSARRHITMREWIMRAIAFYIKEEKRFDK